MSVANSSKGKSKRNSLLAVSLQSSLNTINAICDNYEDEFKTLTEFEVSTLKSALDRINTRVGQITRKLTDGPGGGEARSSKINWDDKGKVPKIENTTKSNIDSIKEDETPINVMNVMLSEQNANGIERRRGNETSEDEPEDESRVHNLLQYQKDLTKRRNMMRPVTAPMRLSSRPRNIASALMMGPQISQRFSGKRKKGLSFLEKVTIHPSSSRSEDDEDEDSAPSVPVKRQTLSKPMSMRPTLERMKSEKSETWAKMARDAFNIIDANHDGFLQKQEVISAIAKMHENGMGGLDHIDCVELAETMMSDVDLDGDGQIDIDEFIQMMKNSLSGDENDPENMMFHNHRMSKLAKNVLMAHQRKMESSVVGNDMWLIHPMSTHHAIWDVIVSLLITLTVITMPLTLGWEQLNDKLFTMNLVIDFIFFLDVCKNFCTGFIDENEAIIMDAAIVRWNYLTGFFLADFCSIIPIDLILMAAGVDTNETVGNAKQTLRMLKLLRMAKLFRLLRISRLFIHIKRIVMWLEEQLRIRISDGFTKLLRLGIGALVLGHWIGCFNFMLVRLNDFCRREQSLRVLNRTA